jgi:hypothetical protein
MTSTELLRYAGWAAYLSAAVLQTLLVFGIVKYEQTIGKFGELFAETSREVEKQWALGMIYQKSLRLQSVGHGEVEVACSY